MIDCYVHTSADVFQHSRVLFVNPSNFNVNLNPTLYSFADVKAIICDGNKGFSDTCIS